MPPPPPRGRARGEDLRAEGAGRVRAGSRAGRTSTRPAHRGGPAVAYWRWGSGWSASRCWAWLGGLTTRVADSDTQVLNGHDQKSSQMSTWR